MGDPGHGPPDLGLVHQPGDASAGPGAAGTENARPRMRQSVVVEGSSGCSLPGLTGPDLKGEAPSRRIDGRPGDAATTPRAGLPVASARQGLHLRVDPGRPAEGHERWSPMVAYSPGPELIVVVAIVILLFGAKKLPELARSVGKSSSEFKRGMSEGAADADDGRRPDARQPAPRTRPSPRTDRADPHRAVNERREPVFMSAMDEALSLSAHASRPSTPTRRSAGSSRNIVERLHAPSGSSPGTRHEAEEIAQDAFLASGSGGIGCAGSRIPSGYLFRTAMNVHPQPPPTRRRRTAPDGSPAPPRIRSRRSRIAMWSCAPSGPSRHGSARPSSSWICST